MKILKVHFSPYPWDVRVEKVGRGLAHMGHEVTLLCRNDRRQPTRETLHGMHIMRLTPCALNSGAANRWWNAPLPVNPVWWAHVAAALRHVRPDVLLVRDIPLAVSCAAVARAFGVPTVLDMAENYPAAMAEWRRWERGSLVKGLTRNVGAARLLEHASVLAVNHVVVVAEEQRERLVAMKIPPTRISLATNTPELGDVEVDQVLLQALRRRFSGRTVMLYVGEMHLHRGLDTAIRALARLRDELPSPLLLLGGKGIHEQALDQLAVAENARDLVHFEGWISPHLVPTYIAACDVALVPHHTSEHTATTLPNKLFDYMAQSRPVVVSDAPPMARIVNAEGCGVVFRSGDPSSLAAAIKQAAQAEDGAHMGARGRAAVLREYNWSVDLARLCGALRAAIAGAGRPAPDRGCDGRRASDAHG